MAKIKTRKKQKKVVSVGIASIKTTFNNTIITISDILGNITIECMIYNE